MWAWEDGKLLGPGCYSPVLYPKQRSTLIETLGQMKRADLFPQRHQTDLQVRVLIVGRADVACAGNFGFCDPVSAVFSRSSTTIIEEDRGAKNAVE